MNNIDAFKRSVTILDTETNNLRAADAEIVEISGRTWTGHDWHNRGTFLMGARNGIPPEASAKNNISQRMINGLPCFDQCSKDVKFALNWPESRYYVAHYAKYDREVLDIAWSRMDSAEDRKICQDDQRWLCTHRLAKAILDHDFDEMQYNLSYLRYRLDLDVPENTQMHRAGHDTFVTGKLLDTLIDYAVAADMVDPNNDVGRQLWHICWRPITIKTFPLGKYRGVAIADIPTDYYIWAIGKLDLFQETHENYNQDLAETVRAELESRLNLEG